jgi:chorismate mutase
MLRGVRGAISVEKDEQKLILQATKELLNELIEKNSIDKDDIASAFFSLTPDLHSEFPAVAAREIGWTDVPLFCVSELDIEGALGKCVRILLHWNTEKKASEIVHLYLKEAKKLRPDKK